MIRPALARGADVVCDRFLDSSLAYQGVARGLGVDAVLELNHAALGGVDPDRTFLLRITAAEAARRDTGRPDRIEGEGLGFLERVAAGFDEVALRFPRRIAVLDATLPVDELAAVVLEGVLAGAAR